METLAEYLDRVMRQKKLKPIDLAKRCGVTGSYIGRVRKNSGNLTVQTMVLLADGLGVNAHEIFTAASGIQPDEATQVDALLLLDLLQRLAHDGTALAGLQQWLQLPTRKRKKVLDFIAGLGEGPVEARGKSRKS